MATRSGIKLGQLNAKNVVLGDHFNDPAEIQFKVYKYSDGELDYLWDKIENFKLVWCKTWDVWFDITVELDEATETVKSVSCVRLGQSELSQINLYNIEINTEEDIARDEYVDPTVLYDESSPENSLLHRIMEKAPHYKVTHVDASIASIQRMFSFDDTSIYDAFQEIAEEIGCIFVFPSGSDEDGNIQRTVEVYDLQTSCIDCGYRGDFSKKCPKCDSELLKEGYGNDTTIFISAEELAESIQFTTDTDSVKNCFKLEAGDDLITATIRNCNPNGSDYIYYITDAVKEDMSPELVAKLDAYDKLYDYYQNDYEITALTSNLLTQYNALVTKYQVYNEDLTPIEIPIKGFPALMTAIYDTIDLNLFLESGLMPDASMDDTDAAKQAALLTVANLSPVAVTDVSIISEATANSAVLAVAKMITDSRYQIKVNSSSLSGQTWTGNFTVTNYSDEEDTATSSTISITINGDYELYLKQTIEKALNKDDTEDLSISGLFKREYGSFCAELKKYSLNSLVSFRDSCQTCLDILVEQGIADSKTWSGSDPNLYDDLYYPYFQKLNAIEAETKVRQDELNLITGTYNTENELVKEGVQTFLEDERSKIQKELDFQTYLGDYWKEFLLYRREDKYSNSNYISDGLNNVELFDKALEFIEAAEKDIYKSAELQHSISTTLRNLLMTKKFRPLLDYFEVGNWIRVMVDDKVYKLRLIGYEIDYDNLESLNVDLSDVMKTADGFSDQQSIIEQAASMSSTYNMVQKQASQGEQSNLILNDWVEKGLDVTNTMLVSGADGQYQTWDTHGMLFRHYNGITDTYDDTQLKILHSSLVITDDNWKTVKTAVGKYYYFDPETGDLKYAYGINAETLVGKLILGEQLGIYNENNSLTFNQEGLTITNKINTFRVTPNADTLLSLSNQNEDLLYVDSNGSLHIRGDGSELDISLNGAISKITTQISDMDSSTTSKIEQLANSVTSQITDLNSDMNSKIEQLADSITLKVSGGLGSNASIQLSVDGKTDTQNLNLSNVRNAFANDKSAITISAGTISFNSNTLLVNSTNLKVAADGSLTATNGNFTGKVTATSGSFTGTVTASSGKIGCWVINSDRMYDNTGSSGYTGVNKSGSGMAFWAGGTDLTGNSSAFRVAHDGAMVATNATITGSITAKSLTVYDSISLYTEEYTFKKVIEYTSRDYTSLPILSLGGSGNSVEVTGDIYLTGKLYCEDAYNDPATSTVVNARITNPGEKSSLPRLAKVASSSARYKNLISEVDSSELQKLYEIPIHWFKYKDGYLNDNDERHDKEIPGFVVEDWEEIMPIAIDHNSDGTPEMWNSNIVVPIMFELIKSSHKEIESLKNKIAQLEACEYAF